MQIGGDPGHMSGADYLDADLLQRVIGVLCLPAGGHARGVDRVVVVAQAQRDGVGRTAELGHFRGRQGARRQRQARPLA